MATMPCYLDCNATAPLTPAARQAMLDAMDRFCAQGANPSSPHRPGHEARLSLEASREEVAALIGAPPRSVVFVSGGTEADNLAVQGTARAWAAIHGGAGHLVASAIEHPAVLEPCRYLEASGGALTLVGVDAEGRVQAGEMAAAIRPDTALVSLMLANNETGVMQPVAAVAAAARERGVTMHVDAVQAAGRVRVSVNALGADLLAISAHKLGGPVGIGALYVREGAPLRPLLFGGSQERRRRPGTEPVALAAGFAAAAREAARLDRIPEIARLRDRLERLILARVPGTQVNGAGAERVVNTSSLTFPGVDNEALVIQMDLRGFAISTGSACSSGSSRPSHVLEAMGLTVAEAKGTVRVSLGHGTTEAEVDACAEALVVEAAARPDWRTARWRPRG